MAGGGRMFIYRILISVMNVVRIKERVDCPAPQSPEPITKLVTFAR